MKSWRIKVVTVGIALAAAISTAYANAPGENRVGALEYVEGHTFLDHQAVAATQERLPALRDGGVLSTKEGHAEMLLTPGVFLRLGSQAEAQLVRSSLTDTLVRLNRGSAIVEANEIHKDNLIRVQVGAETVQLLKTGLYRFNAEPACVEVLSGKVAATEGDRTVKAGKHRTVMASNLLVSKFKSDPMDDLNRWSRLRSEYEAEASLASAQYIYDMGLPWAYSGWLWNPWFDTWAWLPASGYWMNPYGFGYFGPSMVYDYYPARAYGGRRYAYTPTRGRMTPPNTDWHRAAPTMGASRGMYARPMGGGFRGGGGGGGFRAGGGFRGGRR